MSKIRFSILIQMTVLWAVSAQSSNSWIDYEKDYYRIKIAGDGLYRVTASELLAAGVPVGNIAVNRYQLFRRGEEVSIVTRDENNDGRLDYLEFYGQKNDGTTDTPLYVDPSAQPHTKYNLFTDSAAYFLTWHLTNTNGRRMAFSSLKDAAGLTPEAYHLNVLTTLQTNAYSTGLKFGGNFDLQSARYDFGEGWTGGNISKGSNREFNYILSSAVTSGPNPQLSMVITGVSNLEHLIEISAGPDASSLRSLGQASFVGRRYVNFTSELEWSDVGPEGELLVRATVVGLTGQTDVVAIALIDVTYPQELSFTDTEATYAIDDAAPLRTYLSIETTEAATIDAYDVTDPISPRTLAVTPFSDRLELVFENTQSSRKIYVNQGFKTVGSIVPAPMIKPDPDAGYLIIYHPQLNQTVDGVNPVDAYVQYRESQSGGSFQVMDMEIDQVFDQFNYGDPSPLAISSLVEHQMTIGDPQYLFLIGKGTTVNFNCYRQDPQTTELTHFIPTYGFPGSDLLFSVDFDNGNSINQLGTGRLNAFTSADVKAYLDKVIEMEAQPFDQLWRKNLIQLSGGASTAELRVFENYILNFKSIAESDFLGGQAENINKNSTAAVKVINVADAVNDGVNLITFFGHSSGTVTDMEIGRVSDPAAGYSNKGKYPTILVNGCNAGEIFATNFTFGEDWINFPDAGAIAFIANSDVALSSNLKRYSDLFYQIGYATDETFGISLGDLMKAIGARYFELYGSDPTDQSQVYQTLLQGDPAVHLFGAPSPDYEILDSDIFESAFNQDRVLANADSFQINLVVKNFGRTVRDSLQIAVDRTFPDGTSTSYLRSFQRVLRKDTIRFTIPNDQADDVVGNNAFTITLDPLDSVDELNETNNVAFFELFIAQGNTLPLYPIPYASVGDTQVKLVWQSVNMLEKSRGYTLQIDSVGTFNSSYFQNETVEGDVLLTYDLDLSSLPDSTRVYWRTRFEQPEGSEDTTWVQSSFTLVRGISEGWIQSQGFQLGDNSFVGVDYDPITREINFKETSTPLQIATHGVSSGGVYEDYLVLVDGLNLLLTTNTTDPTCKRLNAINTVVFDKESAQPYRPFGITGGDVFNDLVCGRLPQMIHNFNENDVLGSNRYLDSLISVMRTGDMIALFSFDSVAFSNWDAQLIGSLGEVGISETTLSGLVDGQPVIFLGKKGLSPGDAVAITSNGSGIPVKEQVISLSDDVVGKFSTGSVQSVRVGPSIDWQNFSYNVNAEPVDTWRFDLKGITPQGDEEVLFTGSRATSIDISQVDAVNYPYLDISFVFEDEVSQTPPILRSWSVAYDSPPEGILLGDNLSSQTLQEGETYQQGYLFYNFSNKDFEDSLSVDLRTINAQDGSSKEEDFKITGPDAGDTISFDVAVETRGLVGRNTTRLAVSSTQPEQFASNNTINFTNAFEVEQDQTNPVLDVTFDGGYILDGDIVSPNPQVLIKFKDDNEFLVKEDTSGMVIELREPCDECVYERVPFSDPSVIYTPASEDNDFEISYAPGPLADGVYGLRVQGEDATGNSSGVNPYEITFEVINESSITHFYPYPNPFSTQTRFVFTLTGSFIPDRIKIQIMTISGVVVREITQDEIGPLRIGNNITQYAWDGRDEFSDQLANGVYLYKVFVEQNGETIEHRDTSADRAFKNGFGKLYILR